MMFPFQDFFFLLKLIILSKYKFRYKLTYVNFDAN